MNKIKMMLCLCIMSFTMYGQAPVNPNANQTTKNILTYLYDMKGNGILSGQESTYWDWRQNETPKIAWQDKDIYTLTGKYPAVYSSDFGDFQINQYQPTEADCNEKRDDVVNAIKEYAGRGALITMSYHMRPPTVGICEIYDSIKNPKDNNDNYITLTDAQIDEMTTPGTAQYNTMLERFDQIADYFKDLEDEDITVLWRPFHEMNGEWFWWGGLSPSKYIDLWNMMYNHLTYTRGCNNLLWVWSINHYGANADPSVYYPGNSKVDMLGVDIYTNFQHSYAQYIYDDLNDWGGGKPIAFTENGPMPDVSIIKNTMPNMVYWLTWYDHHHSGHNPDALYQSNYGDPYTITLDELPDFSDNTPTNTTRYEAEDAALTGVNTSMQRAGYSGDSYVTDFDQDGDKITFTVNVSNSDNYPLTIRYAANQNQENDVYVNDNLYGDNILFPLSMNFTDNQVGSVPLNAGNNTIEIRKEWGYFDVDYIEITGTIDCEPFHDISGTVSPGIYKAQNYIESDGQVPAGNTVTFQAGNRVHLLHGFRATAGASSKFHALIDDCSTGANKQEIKSTEQIAIRSYPNPFTEQTTIEFNLMKDSPVTLWVTDAMGRNTAVLKDGESMSAGIHEVYFDGRNYAPGIYYYTIQAGEYIGTQKMILIK